MQGRPALPPCPPCLPSEVAVPGRIRRWFPQCPVHLWVGSCVCHYHLSSLSRIFLAEMRFLAFIGLMVGFVVAGSQLNLVGVCLYETSKVALF